MAKKGHKRVVIVGETQQTVPGVVQVNGLVARVSHGEGIDHVAAQLPSRQPNNLAPPPPPHRNKMSVSLNPANALGFRRPLTTLVKRSLTITNHNQQPVAFKVKTTAPKLYCVRPNSGRVEPGESIEVSVMLQALKEEPPLNTKCKDKFLIQSTIITPDKETLPLHDIWNTPEMNEEGRVFQQKLRVTYLPAEGQVLEEEDENQVEQHAPHDEHTLVANGQNGVPESVFTQPASRLPAHEEQAPEAHQQQEQYQQEYTQEPLPEQAAPHVPAVESHPSPPAAVAPEIAAERSSYEHAPEEQESSLAYLNEQAPPIPAPIPAATAPIPSQESPAAAPVYITKENPVNEELYAKYNMAQAEIEQLKAQIASLSATQELRRRTRKVSDVGSNGGSDVMTVVEDTPIQQDGVPLQVVVMIALGVFVTTYLFF